MIPSQKRSCRVESRSQRESRDRKAILLHSICGSLGVRDFDRFHGLRKNTCVAEAVEKSVSPSCAKWKTFIGAKLSLPLFNFCLTDKVANPQILSCVEKLIISLLEKLLAPKFW